MTNAYYLNQFISTTLSTAGGIDDSQTTGIKIASTSGVTTDKPGILCLSYSDPIDTTKAEWISYTSIDVSNELQGVTRGAEGFSAKKHSNGVTVAFPISRSHINNLNDALIIGGTETNLIEGVLDEDTMASDSATKLATQQSIKAYVDSSSGLKVVNTYTSSGTWTKPAGLNFIIVEVVGGGGGGGGSAETPASQASSSGGGGGGGYSRKKIAAGDLGATETVTIGAAGAAGAAGNNNGGNGGNTTFGSHLTGGGGGGGGGSSASGTTVNATKGSGGSASSGDINIPGGDGGAGRVVSQVHTSFGNGGASMFAMPQTVVPVNAAAEAGTGYGGGGTGVALTASQSAAAGAAGSAGICIVYEY